MNQKLLERSLMLDLYLFCSLSINEVNSFLPVSNFGFASTFGFGMKKLPKQVRKHSLILILNPCSDLQHPMFHLSISFQFQFYQRNHLVVAPLMKLNQHLKLLMLMNKMMVLWMQMHQLIEQLPEYLSKFQSL